MLAEEVNWRSRGSKVQGRVHPEDVSMRNEPRYALEMRIVDIGVDFKGFFYAWLLVNLGFFMTIIKKTKR